MNLYHYSKERYDILKSLKRQGTYTEEEELDWVARWRDIEGVAPYHYNISCFCGPINVKQLVSLFPKGFTHPFWRSDTTYYEHVISIDDIPKGTPFMFVETPADTEHLLATPPEAFERESFVKQYLRDKMRRKRLTGEIYDGENKTKFNYSELFERQIRKFSNVDAFITTKYSNKKYQEFVKDGKYASCVPHVMLYPEFGELRVSNINKVQS